MRLNLPIFFSTLILFVAILAAVLLGYLLPQFIRGFLPVDVLTFSFALFLLVTIVILIYVLFLLIKKQRSPLSLQNISPEPIERSLEEPFVRRTRRPQPIERSLEDPFMRRNTLPQPVETADSELQSRLISLLSGDRAAAERLVNQAKLSHPRMPENWYWERVIEGLERDRG